MAVRKRKPRRTWGSLRKLPSGRYQASYTGPDGGRYAARQTFDTVSAADAWLAAQRVEIAGEDWRAPTAPRPKRITLTEYATGWLATRELKPRTRIEYDALLQRVILPDLGALGLPQIDATSVRGWYAKLGNSKPTQRAHAYGLLRTILGSAVDEEIIAANPCRIRGANTVQRKRVIEPATLDQLATIVASVPDRYKAMVLLAAWCGLRFGEVTELRRSDVDLERGVLRIRRGVVRVGDGFVVGTPKSTAGIRDVAIPPHLVPVVTAHLAEHVAARKDALLFPAAGDPSEHMAPATLYRVYYPAREAAGRPDLRWHDLRHTGAVLAAATGATLAELMARLGHSTPAAAMRYQHAAADRDRAIAEALSRLATGA